MAWARQFDSDYKEGVVSRQRLPEFPDTATTARVRGVPEELEDTLVVPFADFKADEPATMVYKCEEVEADKLSAAGAISAGELVRMSLVAATLGEVNTNAASNTNVACGFCTKDATAAATKIFIRFDGTPRGA